MIKKTLKAIPVPRSDVRRIQEIAVKNKNIRGVIISQKKKIETEETLILNVYQASGKSKRDISLLFRVFCQKSDYITFEVDCNKWRTGALLYLTCGGGGWREYWWDYKQLELLKDRDAKRVESTLLKWACNNNEECGDRDVFTLFDKYQQRVKNARLMKKHKKEKDAIDDDMEKFGKLPDDYQQFIEEKVFRDENYIFYNTKKKSAFCTSCKKIFILENKHLRHETIGIWNNEDEVKHNRTVRCPYCNKFILAKSEGMSRKRLISVKWSLLVQSHDEEVLTRYFCHTKDFRIDFYNPKITIREEYRTVHGTDKATDYMWAKYRTTGDMRWCYYRYRGGNPWYPTAETVEPKSVVMYNTNLQETIAGTCMKYSVPDVFIEKVSGECHFSSPWLVDKYFNSYRQHPFIEQLLKVGFYRMTGDFLDCNNHVNLYDGQSSILGTLGINKNQYNMLRKVGNPSLKDLEILRYKPDLKYDEFKYLRLTAIQSYGHVDVYKKYIALMEYTTLHKLRRYISEQKILYEQDYFDYTGWLEEMGYDIRNEFYLFPKFFKKAHDEMSKQYMTFKDKRAKEETKRFNRLLRKLKKDTTEVAAMNLNIDDLFIRLPDRLEELKEEGELLHHCVGTYMEKVKKGKTMIFFIRKRAEPDKPYYTLEWHGRVIQCRGFHNCDMTPEVRAFVEIFQEKMKEYENVQKKQRKAG